MEVGGQPDPLLLPGLDGPFQQLLAGRGQGGDLAGEAVQAASTSPNSTIDPTAVTSPSVCRPRTSCTTWTPGRAATPRRAAPAASGSCGPPAGAPGRLDHLDKLGVATTNLSGFPLVELAVADPADLDAVGRHLFDRGIYVTLAPYPVVPRKEAGFRCHPRMWGDCTRGMAGRAAP